MQQGKLTHAWITASAALPLEWQIMGVVRSPRGAEGPLPGGPKDGDELSGTGGALFRESVPAIDAPNAGP
ncbi:MAG: hypothetical protein ABI622_00120 [Chloroflexota bacterium]